MKTELHQPAIVQQILEAIQQVVGPGPVSMHEPEFSGNEWIYLKECLDSTFVSSVGEFVDRFENELAAYTGAKHAVAVVNGTAALHIALKLAGVQQNDEVLMPALTFVATANAVSYCGATPHFVDSEERTLGIDCEKLRVYLEEISEIRNNLCINKQTGRVIRALVPMHVFGHPSDLDGLLGLARDFHLELVEDAAESLGSYYHGQHTGTFGLMGALSFNGNKTITTGGGGAIITNDSQLAKHAKHLTTTAKLPHRWRYEHDEVGYNYRMPNLNAALGCAQLEKLPNFLDCKRILFKRYQVEFEKIQGLELLAEPAGSQSNYWLQTLILSKDMASQHEVVLQTSNDFDLMTRPIWTPIHKLRPYESCVRMNLMTAESLVNRVINIPSSSQLAEQCSNIPR